MTRHCFFFEEFGLKFLPASGLSLALLPVDSITAGMKQGSIGSSSWVGLLRTYPLRLHVKEAGADAKLI
jgi:hypothetical protein